MAKREELPRLGQQSDVPGSQVQRKVSGRTNVNLTVKEGAGMQHVLHHRLVYERESTDHRMSDTEIVEQQSSKKS